MHKAETVRAARYVGCGQALKLVLATVIAVAILTTTATVAFVDSPFNFKEL